MKSLRAGVTLAACLCSFAFAEDATPIVIGARDAADATEASDIEIKATPGKLAPVKVPTPQPFQPSIRGFKAEPGSVAEAVDSAIETNLATMHIRPEASCDDATFLRRVSLDLIGQIPLPESLGVFLHEGNSQKRASKIKELLQQPEYADHWAAFWSKAWLGQQNEFYARNSAASVRYYLWQQLAEGKSYDQIVKKALTATHNDPAAVSYLAAAFGKGGAVEASSRVARTFLGKRVSCAQCHDHPFDKWTQEDFWAFTSFFSKTNGYNYGDAALNDFDTRLTGMNFDPPEAKLRLPARLLGAEKASFPADPEPAKNGAANGYVAPRPNIDPRGTQGYLYRKTVADWITSPGNEDFDRAAVNRVWAALFGHGLVEPIDDMRPKNMATHPEVLDLLAHDFAVTGRDLKRLLQIIVLTRAYQRSSSGTAVKAERHNAVRYAARAEVRPMTPEMLFGAILKATGGVEKAKKFLDALRTPQSRMYVFNPVPRGGADAQLQEFYGILEQFDIGGGNDDAAGSSQFEGTVKQALMLMNSKFLLREVSDACNHYSEEGMRDPNYLFALTLCRPPSQEEYEAFKSFKGGFADLLWVLLNSAEFVTIH